MSEIVNLKRARKNKSRVTADAKAAQNRLTHGRSKVEKELAKTKRTNAERKLDGHKRDDD